MIVRKTICPECGASVVWVEAAPRRIVVKDPNGVVRGVQEVRRQGSYCEVNWDAGSERDIYRKHQCARLGDRHWRPGAPDFVPALALQPPAEHERQLSAKQQQVMAERERKRVETRRLTREPGEPPATEPERTAAKGFDPSRSLSDELGI